MKRLALFPEIVALALTIAACGLPAATKERPFVNSLGMKFVPVKGTRVLFSIWDTRVQDFEAFVQATGYDATKDMTSMRNTGYSWYGDTWKSPGFTQGPTHPVVGVNWEDAKAFCKWLTEKERREGRLTVGQEYRLPTDTEWSVAVGLGLETGNTPFEKSGKIKGVYPWGTQWPPPHRAGNYAGEELKQGLPWDEPVIAVYNDGCSRTSPVGSFAANHFGLFDMGGNVWQWCEDLYQPNKEWRVIHEAGAKWWEPAPDIEWRLLRGASWRSNDPNHLLSSFRCPVNHSGRIDLNGFRCVLVIRSSSLR